MQKYDTFATNLKGNNFGGESWLIMLAFQSACAAMMHLHDKNVYVKPVGRGELVKSSVLTTDEQSRTTEL